jgi:hypothetical protein
VKSLKETRLKTLNTTNEKLIATLAISHGLSMRVTFELEEFLERREFTLMVEILKMGDENVWKELHGNRRKLFELSDRPGEDPVHLGYLAQPDQESVMDRLLGDVDMTH